MTHVRARDYHGYDPEVGAPFAYDVTPSGAVVRVETDGRGRTVEIPVKGEPAEYGLCAPLPTDLRARYRRIEREKTHADWPMERVRDEVPSVLERRPMTREALASELRVFTHQVARALESLRRRGEAECYASPDAGARKYLWAVTDS